MSQVGYVRGIFLEGAKHIGSVSALQLRGADLRVPQKQVYNRFNVLARSTTWRRLWASSLL